MTHASYQASLMNDTHKQMLCAFLFMA